MLADSRQIPPPIYRIASIVRMSTLVVAAELSAARVLYGLYGLFGLFYRAHNRCAHYNTMSYAVFAAYAGNSVDGGKTVTNGNKR